MHSKKANMSALMCPSAHVSPYMTSSSHMCARMCTFCCRNLYGTHMVTLRIIELLVYSLQMARHTEYICPGMQFTAGVIFVPKKIFLAD